MAEAAAPGGTGVDLGRLPGLLGFGLARAGLVADAAFQAAVTDRSVTPHRYALLEVAAANAGLHQSQLGEALALSRPAVSLIVDYWQARGCVERRPVRDDRRAVGVFATACGLSLLEALRSRIEAQDRRLDAALSDIERAELRRLLGVIWQSGTDLERGFRYIP